MFNQELLLIELVLDASFFYGQVFFGNVDGVIGERVFEAAESVV